MQNGETAPIEGATGASLPARTKRWLWAVRVAAGASILILCIPPWLLWLVLRDPCAQNSDYYMFAGPALAMLPYLRILWRLRNTDEASVPNIKRGLMLAVPWGLPLLAIACFMVYARYGPLSWPETPEWQGAAWAVLGLAQVLLIVAAVAGSQGMKPAPDERKLRWTFVLKVVGFIFLLLVIAVFSSAPLLIRSRLMSNQAAAVGSLRTINTVQVMFADANPKKGFARTLTELGPPPGAGLIDEYMAKGEKWGYRLTLAPGAPDASGHIVSYTVTARPMEYPRTGCRSFFSDESGVIRVTSQDRLATAQDPPLN